MDNINYTKGFFKSIPDCRQKVLIMFLNLNDGDLLNECGFLKMILFVQF